MTHYEKLLLPPLGRGERERDEARGGGVGGTGEWKPHFGEGALGEIGSAGGRVGGGGPC